MNQKHRKFSLRRQRVRLKDKWRPIAQAFGVRLGLILRSKGLQRDLFKKYYGGGYWITLNANQSLKSSPAKLVFLEEPDDAKKMGIFQ